MNSVSTSKTIARRFQPIMHDCRKMALSYLAPLFMRFLENADISLLEAADKAENNQVQAQYFAVMKALKNGRETLTQDFLGKIDKQFRIFIERGAQNPEAIDLDELTSEKMELIEKREMEMSLPVQNVVLRANGNFIDKLYGLEQRLAVVNGGTKVFPEAMPGGVVQIAQAFRDVISLFETDRKLRMMLFVGFDHDVMRELSGYLDEYNRRLANAGLLPNLRYSVTKSKSQGRGAPGGSEPGTQEDDIDGAYEEIRGHLGMRRGSAPSGQRGSVSSQMVSDTLNTLKAADSEEFFNTPIEQYFEDIRIDHNFIDELRNTLNAQIEHLFERLDRNKMDEADEDAIDLVGMLFDFMLQDEDVPNAVKALLSRLQIPYLKVAIHEKQLFIKKSHPARRLLDAMVESGTKWVVEDDLMRGIFPHLRTIVERLHDQETPNMALFEASLDDLRQHVEQLEEKARLIQKRSIAAAEGQERLEMARNAARIVIEKMLHGKTIPQSARSFFLEDWAEKMVFILLREEQGRDSQAWRNAVDTLMLICSVVEISHDDDQREKVRKSYASTREKINFGLEQLRGFGRKDNERMLKSIEEWHQKAVAFSDATEVATDEDVVHFDAPVTDAEEGSDIEALDEKLQQRVEELEHVPFGTWFEFQDETGLQYRLKLAWYSNVSSKFMFVDALGLKAADYHLNDLVKLLEADQLKILDLKNRPFFDRALDAIKGFLGRNAA